jgi:hypothetical protein
MTPELRRIGTHASPVVVIDGFSGEPDAIVEIAAALSPFPKAGNPYGSGLRRLIDARDRPAWDYVVRTLRALAPYLGGGFDADSFALIEASFSIVTARPETLGPAQRAQHFDSTDPDDLAVLHYWGGVEGSGTAFYKQRSTGIERIEPGNLDAFIAVAGRESPELAGYICGSNRFFDQIAEVEAAPDRLVIYQGSLLHSGVIPTDMTFSADPREGRLTANVFVKAERG